MIYIEEYLKKCLEDSRYLKKTSLIVGMVMGLILGIIEFLRSDSIEVAVVVFIVLTVVFSVIWGVLIKRMAKISKEQDDLHRQQGKKKSKKKR